MVNWILVIEISIVAVAAFMLSLMILCYIRRRMGGELTCRREVHDDYQDTIISMYDTDMSKTNGFTTFIEVNTNEKEMEGPL